jgi:ATP-dependent Lon protease
MTGEVTLTGKVLAIGGVKEKALAALRAGIRNIILPAQNKKDVADIPAKVRRQLTIHLVEHVDEVLKLALVGTPKPPASLARKRPKRKPAAKKGEAAKKAAPKKTAPKKAAPAKSPARKPKAE